MVPLGNGSSSGDGLLTGKAMFVGSGPRAVVRDMVCGSATRDHRAIEEVDVDTLIRRFQEEGDRHARDAVMASFDWIAVGCARRMHRRGEPIEDLEQVAREALLGAISRFDVERGVPFKAFAWATAAGVLRHYYRSRWQVRIPRGIQELHLASVKAVEHLTAAAGRCADRRRARRCAARRT